MVFQSERDPRNPFYQIYLTDLETGDIERVSPGFGKTTCAWIHPSGEKVLFASTQDDPEAAGEAATGTRDAQLWHAASLRVGLRRELRTVRNDPRVGTIHASDQRARLRRGEQVTARTEARSFLLPIGRPTKRS